MLPERNVTEPLKPLYVQKQRMHDERPMCITTLMIKCVVANKTDSIKKHDLLLITNYSASLKTVFA